MSQQRGEWGRAALPRGEQQVLALVWGLLSGHSWAEAAGAARPVSAAAPPTPRCPGTPGSVPGSRGHSPSFLSLSCFTFRFLFKNVDLFPRKLQFAFLRIFKFQFVS